jgi:prophage DNA circulation protein
MAATWSDILQDGGYDGVKFEFVRSTLEGGNDIDQQTFPNRAGQKIKGRGRKGRRFRILAIFVEDDYPDTMNALLAKLENGGVPKEFVDPIFGSMQASVENFTVTHDADDASDAATIDISLVEDTNGEQGLKAITNTTPARANAVRAGVTNVFAALSALQAATEVQNDPHVLEVVGLVNAATSATSTMADSLEATGDQLSAPAVQQQANAALASIDLAVSSNADYDSIESYDLGAALLAMSAAASGLAQDLIEAKPPLQIFVVRADTNLLALAFDLYGDSSRAEELLALNSLPDPAFIPVGWKVQAYGT